MTEKVFPKTRQMGTALRPRPSWSEAIARVPLLFARHLFYRRGMLNPSRFAIVDEQVRDPEGNPIGVIRAKPPFLVMTDRSAIVETPEAAQYVEMPEHIDQEWAGGDPPAVYLRFETEQELRRVLARHVIDQAPGYGSGVFGQGPFGGDEPAPPTVNAYDWTGIERRLAASPNVVAAIHEKCLNWIGLWSGRASLIMSSKGQKPCPSP